MKLLAALLLCVSVFCLGVWFGWSMAWQKHCPEDCFFSVYDNLAAVGDVTVNEVGAWAFRRINDSTEAIIVSGFSRTIYIGTLAPGESVKVNLFGKEKP